MIKKYGDIYSGFFIAILSLVLFIASFSIKRLTISRIGAAFVPQIVAVSLFILSVTIIMNGLKTVKEAKSVDNKEENVPKEDIRKLPVIATLVLMAVYMILLDTVGFLIMTAIYLFMQFIILADKSQRKYPLFAIIAVIVSGSVYYLFLYVFRLMLPPGILG